MYVCTYDAVYVARAVLVLTLTVLRSYRLPGVILIGAAVRPGRSKVTRLLSTLVKVS